MIGTALATLALVLAAQGLLVVKVADRLTDGSADRHAGRTWIFGTSGRYARLV